MTDSSTTCDVLTLGDVARRYGCHVWQVRRLYERGLLTEAARVGTYRVVVASELPRVQRALIEAGYLREPVRCSDAA